MDPELIVQKIWYGSQGLHLIGAPSGPPIRVRSDLVALDQLFHTKLSTQQLHQDRGRLRSTRQLFTCQAVEGCC
jgi:hypothetical protein